MPRRISPLQQRILVEARDRLPPRVIDALGARPGDRIPRELWRSLKPEQRRLVVEINRRLTSDTFREGQVTAQGVESEREESTRYPARDPFAVAPLPASTPDPTTGLDPRSMRELFGNVVDTSGLERLEGRRLLTELRSRFFARHVRLPYDEARRLLFSRIDNRNGRVEEVYGGRVADGITGIPDADTGPRMNTEHSVPQSRLRREGKAEAVSNLHGLFPTDTQINGVRGNYPFGEPQVIEWQGGESGTESKLGLDANGKRVFQPPPKQRGNIARAVFWIATAYELQLAHDEEAVLKRWNDEDPVDPEELARNRDIALEQGDLNPFVLNPDLVDNVDDF